MENKAFEFIEKELKQGLEKELIEVRREGENSLFVLKNATYKLEYDAKAFKFNLFKGKDEDFSLISTWLFDEEKDSLKEAKSIVDDFLDTIKGSSSIKTRSKNVTSKESKSESNSTNLNFFVNRLVGIFPELKDEVAKEKSNFDNFRYVSFIKDKVIPLAKETMSLPQEREKEKKFFAQLNNSYSTGNMDVRSVVTIVILNSLDLSEEKVDKFLNKDLKKAYLAGLKFKNKKVKPEKVKKRKNFLAQTLESYK